MAVIYGIVEHGDPEEPARRGRLLAEELVTTRPSPSSAPYTA